MIVLPRIMDYIEVFSYLAARTHPFRIIFSIQSTNKKLTFKVNSKKNLFLMKFSSKRQMVKNRMVKIFQKISSLSDWLNLSSVIIQKCLEAACLDTQIIQKI